MPPEPKKSKHLQEVEDDAVRIQTRRFNDYFEEQQYQKAKLEEAEPSEPVKSKVVKQEDESVSSEKGKK